MATAVSTPNLEVSKIVIEPMDKDSNILERGKTSAKALNQFIDKMNHAHKRCPKLFVVRTTTSFQGDKALTVGFYTPITSDAGVEWVYTEQFPGTTAKVSKPKKAPAAKKAKGETGTTHSSSKGKPGIINAIVDILKGSVDNGGATVTEIVAGLKERFPTREAESMEITVRCQLGRIPKQRGLKIGKQKEKDGKMVRYFIA